MKERSEEITLSSKLKDKGFKFNETVFEKAKKMAESTFRREAKDERFWEAKRDKSGNGYAIIRFLPDKNLNAEFHVLEFYQHYFEASPGKWVVENCPKTVGESCPICQAIGPLWKTGLEANQELYRERKKKLHRFCNIEVIEDPIEPENNGKVFLFEIPGPIHDKIMEKLHPKFPGDVQINIFNPQEAPVFKIKIFTEVKPIGKKKEKKGVRNFTSSTFSDKIEPLSDEKIDELWRKCWDLKQLLTEKKYFVKTAEEIKKKYEEALVGGTTPVVGVEGDAPADIKNVNDLFERAGESAPTTSAASEKTTDAVDSKEPPPGDEDDELSKEIEGMEGAEDDDIPVKLDSDSIFND